MKVLLIDDHALIREALRGVFADLRPQAVVLEAASRAQALEVANASPDLDLILLDLALPDADGLDLLADFRSRRPTTSVVVLSASRDHTVVARALRLGALGFVPKSAPYQVMIAALQVVFAGGIYVPPEILAAVEGAVGDEIPQPVAETGHADPLRELPLTDRQRDVLALLVQGKSNKSICRELQLAEPTVKNHVTAILKALKVTSRTEAVVAVGVRGSRRQ
jgi:DNA-binding NarL/FixJ family response regulator